MVTFVPLETDVALTVEVFLRVAVEALAATEKYFLEIVPFESFTFVQMSYTTAEESVRVTFVFVPKACFSVHEESVDFL